MSHHMQAKPRSIAYRKADAERVAAIAGSIGGGCGFRHALRHEVIADAVLQDAADAVGDKTTGADAAAEVTAGRRGHGSSLNKLRVITPIEMCPIAVERREVAEGTGGLQEIGGQSPRRARGDA
jgi:hypothetical protein